MGFLKSLARPFRTRSSSAEHPPPSSGTDSASATQSNKTSSRSAPHELPWYRSLRRPFKAGRAKKVRVTAKNYLGFDLDSGYHSENTSGNQVNDANAPVGAPVESIVSSNGSLTDLIAATHDQTCGAIRPVASGNELHQVFRQIAYSAGLHKCPTAIATVEKILRLDAWADKHTGPNASCNESIVWNDREFSYNSINGVGQDWLARVVFAQTLENLGSKKSLLDRDEAALIVRMLFPLEDYHVQSVSYGRLLINNLADSGLMTRDEVDRLASLVITIEEFRKPDTIVERTYLLPQPKSYGVFKVLPVLGLETPLYNLARAAVHRVSEYAGGMFRDTYYDDARSALKLYVKAYEHSEQGRVPPALYGHARCWSVKAKRILQRSKLVLDLLERYEAGKVEFRFFHVVRNAFFPVDFQVIFDHEDFFHTAIWDRFEGSGVSVDEMPKFFMLLPSNDDLYQAGGQPVIDFEAQLEQDLKEQKQFMKHLAKVQKAAGKDYKTLPKEDRATFDKATTPFDPWSSRHEQVNYYSMKRSKMGDGSIYS